MHLTRCIAQVPIWKSKWVGKGAYIALKNRTTRWCTIFVQVDQSISHHDMWDYLELTQKGYSKAFEPVNELLTQVSTETE